MAHQYFVLKPWLNLWLELSLLFLSGRSSVVFSCCSQSASRSDVCSEMVFCLPWLQWVVIWLTVASLSSWTSLTILLQFLASTRHFCRENCHWWLCVKVPVDQLFLKHPDYPVCHQQPCHIQSHLSYIFFCPHSGTWFEFQHVVMTIPTCLNALSCCFLIGRFSICIE